MQKRPLSESELASLVHAARVKRAYVRMKMRAAANARQVDETGQMFCAALQASWDGRGDTFYFCSRQAPELDYERNITEHAVPQKNNDPKNQDDEMAADAPRAALNISKQHPLIVFVPLNMSLSTKRVQRCRTQPLRSVNVATINAAFNEHWQNEVYYVRTPHSRSRSRSQAYSDINNNDDADDDNNNDDDDYQSDGSSETGNGGESESDADNMLYGIHGSFLPTDAMRGDSEYVIVGHTWGPVNVYWRHIVFQNLKPFVCISRQTYKKCIFSGTYALRDIDAEKTFDRVLLNRDGQYAEDYWHLRRELCLRNEDHRRYRTI